MPGVTLDDLSASGSHRTGHFRLSSGLHSSDYLQLALHLAAPRRARLAGRALADVIQEKMEGPDLVVSPAIGGLIIGHETASALDLPFLFAERDQEGAMVLRRGFAIERGQRIVVVEDVITTGGSVREVIAAIERDGGRPVGVGSLVNRSGVANPFAPLPFAALVEVSFPTWQPDECPLCRDGIPIEKPGSRPVT
jgi:orotate phosphoribosyltransferase